MSDADQQLLEGQLQAEMNRKELESERLVEKEATRTTGTAEAEYASQLALKQSQANNEARAFSGMAKTFEGPSLLKYLIILIVFAIPNDLIDAIELTGYLIVLSWLISFFLSATSIIVMWFSDSELKRVQGHMAQRGKYKQVLTKNTAKLAAKLSKFAPRNPVVKVIAGAILEMIPIISILPWASISVCLAYWDERQTFNAARESYEETPSTSSEAIEMV